MLEFLEKATLHPTIERTHRRATPYLVINTPRTFSSDRPSTGQAQIPPEYERHFVFWVGLCALHLMWIPLDKKRLCLFPYLLEWCEKHTLL